ncbi:MAG: ABC transporter permease [Spirochaetaceae bacterium]
MSNELSREAATSFSLNRFLKTWGTLIGFFFLLLLFSLLRPGAFPTLGNLRNVIEQVATLAIASAGVGMVMVTGDFDLSVGAVASLCGVAAAKLMVSGLGVGPAILLALLLGAVIGAVNGVLIAYAGVSPFIGTLAAMTSYTGLALFVTRGTTVFGMPEAFRWFGQGFVGPIPVSVIIMVLVVIVTWLILDYTTFGQRLYAIGGNREAAFLAGINTQRERFLAYVYSGVTASVSGIVLTSRLFSAHPQAGAPFMLNAAAAVFLGMTAFREGQANVFGTLLGVMIMGVLGNGLNIIGINTYIQSVLTGAILVLAVLLSGLAQRSD